MDELLERIGQLSPAKRRLFDSLFREKGLESAGAPDDDAIDSPVLALRPGGRGPTLFFVHPVIGSALCYRHLALRLGGDASFYGLQSIGLGGGHPPHARVETMAEYYIGKVRAVRPEEPYDLGGWSMGGAVAYEMARQFEAQGQQVRGLILLDSAAPGFLERHTERSDLEYLAAFAFSLNLTVKDLTLPLSRILELGLDEQISYLLGVAKAAKAIPQTIDESQFLRLLEVFKANSRAAGRYVPATYSGRVTLIRASDSFIKSDSDETLGWGSLATRGVTVQTLPGTHHSVLQPPLVEQLAKIVNACLANV